MVLFCNFLILQFYFHLNALFFMLDNNSCSLIFFNLFLLLEYEIAVPRSSISSTSKNSWSLIVNFISLAGILLISSKF